jgi:Raf kinase inhibitor-like YbhB/YbcL family protein
VVHAVAVIRTRLVALVVAALACAPALAACSDDGRELAPPGPDQTRGTAPPVTDPAVATFALTSDAFPDGGEIPPRHTCAGDSVSPDLHWTGAPAAAELAIVMRDRDANGFVHWIVTGIDPTITGFGEAGVPEGAVEQASSTGAIGYRAPCPPAGDARHVYDIVLHVLDAPLPIDPALPAADVAALIEGASTSEAPLAGTVTPTAG